jgi:hypothetical protein
MDTRSAEPTPIEIVERPVIDPMSACGLRLAPTGGLVAFATPQHLEVLALDGSSVVRLAVSASSCSWSADAKRLWFARRMERARCSTELGGMALADRAAGSSSESVIVELDVESQDVRPIAWGHSVCVSSDGSKALVVDLTDDAWRLVDTGTGSITSVTAPLGAWGMRLHALSADGLAAIEADTTVGRPQEYLGWGLTHPRWSWALKLFDLRTGEFATLADRVGYDAPVAFRPATP